MHWTDRRDRLARKQLRTGNLRRAERRQLRKLALKTLQRRASVDDRLAPVLADALQDLARVNERREEEARRFETKQAARAEALRQLRAASGILPAFSGANL